ncbi:hypothetical protein Acsp06_47820 [Actinomycetospora sp. NBRC 106375]|uniref:hypothetical protein n=1 Tax=Actinomycetospora sp. NBRC 106375 TaxID=3032207 RepID=UPI0024A52334|nr:hypothetical protein [Actinomycetospora sp. NBRC 106375]GLZ48597.1 hypothetical protein Acsp06_47820 [Actinomycetospora sp. NBRC 106375]
MTSDVIDLPDVDDAWAWAAACEERGWGDGLPTVPPTEERVAAMLAATPTAVDLGPLPPRGVTPTPRSVAANAVMAGCRPADMPVLLAALAAVQDEAYNLHGTLATTHPCAPMVMVSGPARAALGFNAGGNCLGQGTRANAVVGRALSLVLLHVGGATPGVLDRSTQGSPAKYTFCFAESDESPWPSSAVRRGFGAEQSVVSVMAAEPPHNVNDHGSTTGAEILLTIAGTMAQPGSNNVYVRGPHLLLLGPEHAATLHRDGWTPDSIRAHLWEHARIPVDHVSDGNRRQFVEWGVEPDGDAYTVSDAPGNLHIAVAGGAGKHSAWIPSFGGTELVSRVVPG